MLSTDAPAEPTIAPAAEVAGTRYLRLNPIDRYDAETLNSYCRAIGGARHIAGRLANLAAVQSLRTAFPLAIADFGSLYLCVYATTAVVERLMGVQASQVENQTAFFVSLVILPVAHLAGLYPGVGHNPIVEFRQVARSLFVSLCVLAGIGWFCFPQDANFYVISALLAFCVSLPAVVTARFLARQIGKRCRWWGIPTFVLAEPERAVEIFRRLQLTAEQGFRPAGVLLDPEDYWSRDRRTALDGITCFDVRDAGSAALEMGVTLVVVSSSHRRSVKTFDSSLAAIPNRVLLSSDRIDMGIWDHIYSVGSATGLRLSGVQHDWLNVRMKRLGDLLLAAAAVIVGAPLWVGLYLLVRLTSDGPVFYGQRRIGRLGREFTAWKFRTMYTNADQVLDDFLRSDAAARAEWDETHKLANDPRVTAIGRVLRATSLDELPQIWNVIVGEMSLVGPRPIVDSPTYDRAYITDYPAEFEAYKTVRPGLTGLWQVRCRNRGVYEMRIYYDMYYIRNWCIWLDLYLIMRTFKTIAFGEGK